jgi:UDP-N-acetyl-D-mannosaminuronate dehydrogenase
VIEKVVVVGGGGDVGLPLALVLADSGYAAISLDISLETVNCINSGKMPFFENGAQDLLEKTLAMNTFSATTDHKAIESADIVIVVIGTPVDEHLNPDPNSVVNAISACIPFMNSSQLVVLRSTVFPGVTSRVTQLLMDGGLIAPDQIPTPNGVIRLAAPSTNEEYARVLYQALRSADQKGLEVVVVLQPGGDGLAAAIRDRLQRSAHKS